MQMLLPEQPPCSRSSTVKSSLTLYNAAVIIPPRYAGLRARANPIKGQIPEEAYLEIHSQVEAEAEMEIKCNKPWRCHPEVDLIREEAYAWLRKYVYIPELEAADVPLLQLSMVPCGSIQGTTMRVKFMLFLIVLDDLMDQFLESDPHSIFLHGIFTYILAILDLDPKASSKASSLNPPQEFPLLLAFGDICCDIRTHASPPQWKRFAAGMAAYLQGVIEQLQLKILSNSSPPDLFTYVCIRRKVLGGPPAQALVQLVLGVDVEETMLEDAIQKLLDLAHDYIAFTNDIVSIDKDDGVIWNVVSILQATIGCTMREAILLTCKKVEAIEAQFDSMREAILLTCKKVEAIEAQFDSLLQNIKASPLVQNRAPVLQYLDAISSFLPAYIMYHVGHNKRHATHHTTINNGDSLILKLSYNYSMVTI